MTSVFRGVIEFFVRLGIYDVILPFLLVFTIVFAIFEKTKVFGTEKFEKEEVTRKNLNAMAAFVIAFLVVASSRLVAIINETMANMVLLLMLVICFLILIGSFAKQSKEGISLEGTWKKIFMIIMFVGIVLIFLNALGWLEPAWYYLMGHWDSNVVASILLFAFVVGMVYWITADKKPDEKPAS
jgi:hypothetical protein